MKIVYSVYGMVAGGKDCDEKFGEFDTGQKAVRFIQGQLKRTKDNVSAKTWPGKHYRFTIREDYVHSYEN